MSRSKEASASKPRSKRSKPRLSAAEMAPQILELLPAKAAQIAKALDRQPSDGTVRRALQGLSETGAAEKDADGVWQRCQQLPTLATPDDFDEESCRLHAETLEALQVQGTWRDHDIELLNDYVRRSQDARLFRDAVAEAGKFQETSTGRVFAHPGIDKERDARRDVQALREALVLTPDARKRHGRDGEAEGGDGFDDF